MSSGLDAKVRDILVRKRVVLDLMSLGARPAGFEPATRGLEVRNTLTSGNNLKREKPLSKPNTRLLRLLQVSGCFYGLGSG